VGALLFLGSLEDRATDSAAVVLWLLLVRVSRGTILGWKNECSFKKNRKG
jgi:hypothetical protein